MRIDEKESVDVVFVILHYLAVEATIKAIDMIKENIDTDNYKIVVVDNASPDKSGTVLQQKYAEDDLIKVIINSENLGFARGNNVGFKYAKEQYTPSFIILMNNDVYLLEKRLLYKVTQEYDRSRFAVLGPLIMTKDGKCDINPYNGIKSKSEIFNVIKLCKRALLFNKLHLLSLYKKLSELKNNTFHKQKPNYKEYIHKEYNVHLHGCFMVFSKEYIDKFDGLDDRTFLYMEEDILYKHMVENNMTTVYTPDIVVYHEEDAATNATVKRKREKVDFVYKNLLKSCEILWDIYDNYEKHM